MNNSIGIQTEFSVEVYPTFVVVAEMFLISPEEGVCPRLELPPRSYLPIGEYQQKLKY
jgi:hypothetical protein